MAIKIAVVSLSLLLIVAANPLSAKQERTSNKESLKACSEIAHRIAWHYVIDGNIPSSNLRTKKLDLEMMISHLCKKGPSEFDEFYWIDVNGAYQPYYEDEKGRKRKYPLQVERPN